MEPALLQEEQLISLAPAKPLWQRVPSRDEQGRMLGDFMMFIPGLKREPVQQIQQTINKLNKLLQQYEKYVVFVELNLKMNTLWVSHRQQYNIGFEIAAAIHTLIPRAKLVAQHHE